MEKKFLIQDVLSASWELLKNNFWFIVGLQAIIFAIGIFPEVMNWLFTNNSAMETVLLAVGIIFFILQLIANIGMVRIFLDLHDKKENIQVTDLLSGVNYFFEYVLAAIVYNVIVFIGFLLFIIPGIIWSIKYQFFTYLIVDKRMSPMQALKESARITQGQKMDLFLFSCVAIVLNLAGALALGVGLLITMPLTSLALAHIFRKLSAEPNIEVQNIPTIAQD
jgi:uncharacterized membrane protein